MIRSLRIALVPLRNWLPPQIIPAATASGYRLRLWREDGQFVRLLTDCGAQLEPGWLGSATAAGGAEAHRLDGAWERVALPGLGHVPDALVRQWQTQNERTLIEFRIPG